MSDNREVTNAELQAQLDTTGQSLDALKAVNTDQTARLVRVETQMMEIPDRLKEVSALKNTISHYTGAVSGAIAVLTILGGVVAWIAQQSISTTFQELRTLTTAVSNLQRDVAIIQYQLSQTEKK